MPTDQPAPASANPATRTPRGGRAARRAGTGLSVPAVVVLGVPLVAVLWLLAVLEDRARRRAGMRGPAPCCGDCEC